VLDLGCGPGHWTGHLHALGVDVTGVDMVPEFVAHARAHHHGPPFLLGSMTELDLPEHSVAGILAWYSTIHLPPPDLDRVLAGFRRLLTSSGVLVVGFFDSDDDVAAFDHKVVTAYRWPADVFAQHLAEAGFTEVERLRKQFPERPDRRYAAIAARAS
jgi:SAM-dependent methyltransferase